MNSNSYTISPLGDSALIIDLEQVISPEINENVFMMYDLLLSASIPGVKDIVPSYCSIAIHFDPCILIKSNRATNESYQGLVSNIKNVLRAPSIKNECVARTVRVPVCYSEKYAPDLEEMSRVKSLTRDEIIHIHESASYKVYMIGFLPGFAYMGQVDERIAMDRKATPRNNIAAGSVGIAGNQTGIYPLESPGGWQIIGRTPLLLFDTLKKDPVFFNPGDMVQFYSITEDEFENY